MTDAQQPVTEVVVPEATPDDVAALLRARTKDEHGNELGEWTTSTRPTLEQVQEQIEIARSLVRGGVGEVPDACLEAAEAAVALLAACLCELSYFPEQVRSDRSPYDQLWALFQRAETGLTECVTVHRPDGSAGGVYELDLSGGRFVWPFDWWQRNLEVAP